MYVYIMAKRFKNREETGGCFMLYIQCGLTFPGKKTRNQLFLYKIMIIKGPACKYIFLLSNNHHEISYKSEGIIG